MPGLPSNRVARAGGAALVLLLHVGLVWMLTRTSFGISSADTSTEPAPIAIVELAMVRTDDVGPAPVQVPLADAPRLQIDAPVIPDILTDEPVLPTTLAPTLPPASTPTPQSASAGMNGKSEDSAGQ